MSPPETTTATPLTHRILAELDLNYTTVMFRISSPPFTNSFEESILPKFSNNEIVGAYSRSVISTNLIVNLITKLI